MPTRKRKVAKHATQGFLIGRISNDLKTTPARAARTPKARAWLANLNRQSKKLHDPKHRTTTNATPTQRKSFMSHVQADYKKNHDPKHPTITRGQKLVQKNIKAKVNKNKKNNIGKGGKGGGGGNVNGRQTYGAPTGDMMDEGLSNDGAQLYDPNLADRMANQEFDPQLQVLHNEQGQQHRDAAQAMHDIEQWYGQVQSSQATAATRNKEAGSRAVSDVGKVVSGILSSLGGSANMGSGMVAGQGANDASTVAEMANAENQYQNDLAPLLKLEQTGASRSEQARQSHVAQDLVNQVLQVTGQKGAARTQNQLQLKSLNNEILNHRLDTLMGIKTANNATRQQAFQNAMTIREQKLAAAMTGAQIDAYKAQSSGGSGFTPWAKLDPSQKDSLIKAAIGNKLDSEGGLIGNPANAWNIARQYLTGQGFSSAARGAKGRAPTQISQMLDAALRHAIAINARRQQMRDDNG